MLIKGREVKGRWCSACRQASCIDAGATSRWNLWRAWAGSVAGALLVPAGDIRWQSLPLSAYMVFLSHEQHLMWSNLIVAVVKEAVEVLLLLSLLLLSLLLMVMMMLDWCLSFLFYSFFIIINTSSLLFLPFLFLLKGNQLDKHQLLWLTSHGHALLSGIPCKMFMYLWETNSIWFDGSIALCTVTIANKFRNDIFREVWGCRSLWWHMTWLTEQTPW